MASAATLLDDEDDDKINDDLLEFYISNLMFLKNVPLSAIDPSELRKIAVRLHSGTLYGDQWREYGFSFGIKSYYDLDSIEQSASKNKELPLYMALITALRQGKSIGQIIKILICKEKLDVLQLLKPYVSTLLETNSSHTIGNEDTPLKKEEFTEVQSFNTNCTLDSFEISQNLWDRVKSCDQNKIPSSSGIRKKEVLQKYSANFSSLREKCSEQSDAKFISLKIEPLPSAPVEELRVFIMHTKKDIFDANELSARLRESNISVIKYEDIEPFILMDSMGALTSIFLQVDFIIPVVSQDFLHQIYPQDFVQHIDSDNAMDNRCLYQLLINEYRKNRCLNFRVRPVLIPGFDKNLLRHNLILSPSLRLWSEVSKLINVLQNSKEILSNFSLS